MTPQELAQEALGINWEDTETAARRVAEHAVDVIKGDQEIIGKLTREIVRQRERINTLETTILEGPVPAGKYAYVADKRRKQVERRLATVVEALEAARDHLDYIGYGDRWERECAEAARLEEKIEQALKEADHAQPH